MSLQDKLAALKAKKNEVILRSGEGIQTSGYVESTSISSVRNKLDLLKDSEVIPLGFYVDNSSNKVRLVIMLDKSSSMEGTEMDIYEGFSELIDKHRDDDILVTLVTFNGIVETIFRDLPIDKVKPQIISTCGSTNLNGALYETITSYNGVSDRINLFVTISDGDNNINDFKESLVSSLIRELSGDQNKFYFLGEADEKYMKPEYVLYRAKQLGFCPENIAIFTREYSGNRINLQVISDMLNDLLDKGEIRADWDEPIVENYLRLTNGRRGF